MSVQPRKRLTDHDRANLPVVLADRDDCWREVCAEDGDWYEDDREHPDDVVDHVVTRRSGVPTGGLRAWGANTSGQLGNGATTNPNTVPEKVNGFS